MDHYGRMREPGHLYRLCRGAAAGVRDGLARRGRCGGRSTAEAVEEALYRHRQPLFGAVSIAFLDTTTLWFEGAGGESLGQYGHSKDYRGHLTQVALGIVLDDANRPIASFLMPGNTADVTLLLPVVKRLRKRFGIREACIVADRCMISADTIAALEAEKIECILGVRERTSHGVRAEIIEDDGLAVPLLIPRQKGETELAVRETTIAGRYVICRNAEAAKKDAAAGAELVVGLERKLAQGDKALVANKGFRRFLKTAEGDGFVIDRAKVEADARFDGLFVLRTNTKIAALQVVLRYRNLLAVEDAFKTAKALLATRPDLPQERRRHPRPRLLLPRPRPAQGADRSSRGPPQPARMAAHRRRSRRSQRNRR